MGNTGSNCGLCDIDSRNDSTTVIDDHVKATPTIIISKDLEAEAQSELDQLVNKKLRNTVSKITPERHGFDTLTQSNENNDASIQEPNDQMNGENDTLNKSDVDDSTFISVQQQKPDFEFNSIVMDPISVEEYYLNKWANMFSQGNSFIPVDRMGDVISFLLKHTQIPSTSIQELLCSYLDDSANLPKVTFMNLSIEYLLDDRSIQKAFIACRPSNTFVVSIGDARPVLQSLANSRFFKRSFDQFGFNTAESFEEAVGMNESNWEMVMDVALSKCALEITENEFWGIANGVCRIIRALIFAFLDKEEEKN